MRQLGHVELRRQRNEYKREIIERVRSAVADEGVVQNKVWIDVLIQKPNHRGDAANFIDFICDAVRDAIGIDDRWFCIRRVDWQIVKEDPRIFIGVGQENIVASQACSSCGRVLPFDKFQRHKGTKSGFARNCKQCCGSHERDQRRK